MSCREPSKSPLSEKPFSGVHSLHILFYSYTCVRLVIPDDCVLEREVYIFEEILDFEELGKSSLNSVLGVRALVALRLVFSAFLAVIRH